MDRVACAVRRWPVRRWCVWGVCAVPGAARRSPCPWWRASVRVSVWSVEIDPPRAVCVSRDPGRVARARLIPNQQNSHES
eukprot:3327711-Prymnesium_polylepis.1